MVIELLGTGDNMFAGLTNVLGKEVVPDAPMRVEWVGPKAGAQLRNAAVQSIAITLIAIMIYVGLRFDMRFAPGAVLCLIHDACVAVGAVDAGRQGIEPDRDRSRAHHHRLLGERHGGHLRPRARNIPGACATPHFRSSWI
jgi:hypothetical protein